MNTPIISLIAAIAYHEDSKVRVELINKIITSENDYISNLTKGIRDSVINMGFQAFCHSQTLSNTISNKTGCDAIIILKLGSDAKICFFEAKWPRITQNNYRWDRLQGQISHFTNQIRRQIKWNKIAAIWELFIVEEQFKQQPAGWDSWASTCTWHDLAYHYDTTSRQSNIPWKTSDLLRMMRIKPSLPYGKNSGRNIYDMLMRTGNCTVGVKNKIERDGYVSIKPDGDESSIKIPAGLNVIEDKQNLEKFCEKAGIEHILFIDCNDPAEKESNSNLNKINNSMKEKEIKQKVSGAT